MARTSRSRGATPFSKKSGNKTTYKMMGGSEIKDKQPTQLPDPTSPRSDEEIQTLVGNVSKEPTEERFTTLIGDISDSDVEFKTLPGKTGKDRLPEINPKTGKPFTKEDFMQTLPGKTGQNIDPEDMIEYLRLSR